MPEIETKHKIIKGCKDCNGTGRIESYHNRSKIAYNFRCACDKGQSFSNLIKDWFNAYTKIGWVKKVGVQNNSKDKDERIRQAREANRPSFIK